MNGNIESLQLFETEVIFVPMDFHWNCCSLHLCVLMGLLLAIIVYMHILKYVFLERDSVVCRLAEYEGRCRLLKSIQIWWRKNIEILVNTFSKLEVYGEVRSIRHCSYLRLQKNRTWNLEFCDQKGMIVLVRIHSFIQYSVWRQVQSLLQNDAST